LRRVDLFPVDFEQLIVRNPSRIVGDLDRLAIPGLFRADQLIGWVRFGSTAVTNDSFDNAGRFIEGRLNAPKASARENGGFYGSGRGILSVPKVNG
jgi:hypothetical protein